MRSRTLAYLFHFWLRAAAFLKVVVSTSLLASTVTNVMVNDDYFWPAGVVINVGDTVNWKWTGRLSHTVTSTAGLWDSGEYGKGYVFTNTFNKPGTYPYDCTVHALIQTGMVQVLPSANLPILSSPIRLSDNIFQFTYATAPGSQYVVLRSTNLLKWVPIVTNTAAGSNMTVFDDGAWANLNLYRVKLLSSQ